MSYNDPDTSILMNGLGNIEKPYQKNPKETEQL